MDLDGITRSLGRQRRPSVARNCRKGLSKVKQVDESRKAKSIANGTFVAKGVSQGNSFFWSR